VSVLRRFKKCHREVFCGGIFYFLILKKIKTAVVAVAGLPI
jgi:hypothetical protein